MVARLPVELPHQENTSSTVELSIFYISLSFHDTLKKSELASRKKKAPQTPSPPTRKQHPHLNLLQRGKKKKKVDRKVDHQSPKTQKINAFSRSRTVDLDMS
jgi:hypothetical protein